MVSILAEGGRGLWRRIFRDRQTRRQLNPYSSGAAVKPWTDAGNANQSSPDPTPEKTMYEHILIATDGSDLAGKAVAAGFDLARQLGAQVTVVTVTEPWTAFVTSETTFGFPVDEYEKTANESASRILAGASELARKADLRCATVHAKDQFPAEGILETANKNSCDLIVMASHGRRGLGRLLLGSQAVRVLTHSTVPVLICR
jgi:nucleotide-binding universal stress UspA family protein